MAADTKLKQQIYQLIELMPAEQLPKLLHFLKSLLQPAQPGVTPNTAPIYQVHEHALDTGISDLAAQHDHYLYGISKNDA